MNDFLEFIGICTLLTIGCFLIAGLYVGLKELIYNLKWKYKYKHRFDKPPTAKCYCKDCVFHDPETHVCYGFIKEQRRTSNEWFCWKAAPRKDDPDVPR